jgi:hypothetical protein
VIGGDGTLKGAYRIWEEAERRGLKIAVVGVPKTIDNDINFVYKTFGFDTAVSFASECIDSLFSTATSHVLDSISAFDLLLFLAWKHSHKHLPDTFVTLAISLVDARHKSCWR